MSGIIEKRNDFKNKLNEMLKRGKNAQGGFARIYAMYQRFQLERFESENSSEGDPWTALNPKYSEYKKKRYGGGPKRSGGNWKSYPGTGSKMLIATSTLAGSVIGPGSPFGGTDRHRALFSESSMRISVEMSGVNADGKDFDYAERVAEDRPFMEFSNEHIGQMKNELSKFIVGF